MERMKKHLHTLAICLILTMNLSAQEEEEPIEAAPTSVVQEEAPVSTESSKEWQNWVFVGVLAIVATIAVLFVAADNGHEAHH